VPVQLRFAFTHNGFRYQEVHVTAP
jgi:hypothetical protein